MIVVVHDTLQIKRVTLNEKEFVCTSINIVEEIVVLAQKFPNEYILWVNEKLFDFINWDYIFSIKIKPNAIYSFATSNPFLPNALGYVDQNALLKIPKNVIFQTWQMSTDIGIISASLLLKVQPLLEKRNCSFGYFLNSIAQRFLISGLFSYSNPNLLNKEFIKINTSGTTKDLFVFVKQHYNLKRLLSLFFCLLFFESKIKVWSLISTLKFKKFKKIKSDFNLIHTISNQIQNSTVDVVIPTIGRAKYLQDFLFDLAMQTYKPSRIIIVEQNPEINSASELDFIKTENWPFEIIHKFIHQIGACNARNLALQEVNSDWIFFADDDIRIEKSFLQDAVSLLQQTDCKAGMFACLLPNQSKMYLKIHHTSVFGSGCAIVHQSIQNNCLFDKNYEFCFGEDYDFGMQLRNHGTDILYFPNPEITHLKAPIGGFRTKPVLPWCNEPIQPKPAPTILLNQLKHKTVEQYRAYKLVYFIKVATWTDWATFFYSKRKKWAVSLRWANLLLNKSI